MKVIISFKTINKTAVTEINLKIYSAIVKRKINISKLQVDHFK